jgi:hypothetical protein
MNVDEDREDIRFLVYDAYGGHTLAFRFLRRRTAGKYPPVFKFREEVKTQPQPKRNAGQGAALKKVPTAGAKPRRKLQPKTRKSEKEKDDEGGFKPYTGPDDDEEVMPNPFENLLLPPVKRKAESEAASDGGHTKNK